jgi:hypothetical protein
MRPAVVVLGSLAILFAPASGDDAGAVASREPIGARILAPTVSEAIVADGPRLAPKDVAQTWPGAGWIMAAVLAAAAARSLFGLPPNDRAPGTGSRVLAIRAWIPRGPPGLQTD